MNGRGDVLRGIYDGLRWLNARLGAIEEKVDANQQETRATLSVHDTALKEIVPVFRDIAPAVKTIGAVMGSPWVKRCIAGFGMAFFGALGTQIKSCYELRNIGSNVQVAVDNTQTYDEAKGEIVTAAGAAQQASEQSADAVSKVAEASKAISELKPKPPPVKRKPPPRPTRPPPKPEPRGFVGEFLDRLFP